MINSFTAKHPLLVKRGIAYLIDMLVFILTISPFLIIYFVMFYFSFLTSFPVSTELIRNIWVLYALLCIIALIIFNVFFTFLPYWKGATLGQKLVKVHIQLQKKDHKLSIRSIFILNAPFFLFILLLALFPAFLPLWLLLIVVYICIDIIYALKHEDETMLHDLLAETQAFTY